MALNGLLSLTLAATSSAAVLISNYPGANDLSTSTIASLSGLFVKAAGFTMPGGSAYALDSVTLRLIRNDANATMVLNLFGDGGGNPTGPALVGFVVPAFGVGPASDVTFLPTDPFTLQPLTTYWIVATGSSPTGDGISWTASSPVIAPTGLATSAGYRFSSTGNPVTSVSSTFNTYELNGTLADVPEPSTLGMMAVGILGMLAASNRRR